MKGFKDFLLRGNLIELAVAFIMGTVFAAVVEAFTKIVLDVLGLIVQVEGLSETAVVGINIGNFLTALITFVLTAVGALFRRRRALQPAECDPQEGRAGEGRLGRGPAGRDPRPAARPELIAAAHQEPWCGGRSAISRSSSADHGRSATTGCCGVRPGPVEAVRSSRSAAQNCAAPDAGQQVGRDSPDGGGSPAGRFRPSRCVSRLR